MTTVVRATRIAYLERGRVVASGSHAGLLDDCPPYRQLYETQFKRQEADGPPPAGDGAEVAARA